MLGQIVKAIDLVPAVLPHLSNKARYIYHALKGGDSDAFYFYEGVKKSTVYKSYDYMLDQITRMVTNLYNNNLGGEFIDLMANLISGQLTQAFRQAWEDEGNTDMFMPDYLNSALETLILNQYDFVDQYFRDVIDARIDKTPIGPLLLRAQMWANQWNAAYRQAQELIRKQSGGNLVWVKGATEHGCRTCAALDGIVMSASEWETLGVHPRGYPNPKLECEGGGPANNCDCTLEPTDKRRSPNAYGRVEEIIIAFQK